ncbi:ABC transporter permease [Arvimicrobium flavum]|uniref:ABC transporter permease n=1 Tax=Arvimicrobium flavum TaxID=3393320 RepID=UPI00237B97D8|nr:ABC transporter permease [Mesorhizobium shangrilense]
MAQIRFLLLRLMKAVFVLLAVTIFSFALIRAAPGDPAMIIAGDQGAVDAAFLEEVRARYGLDRPVYEQLALYVGQVARLDFGTSYRFDRPVIDLIAERLPATLLLTMSAFGIAVAAGVGLGAFAARHVGKWQDAVITVFALLFFALPLFWVGLMGILVFSVWLGWLPAFGMSTVGGAMSPLGQALDIARHLVLPTTTLALVYLATYTRMTRASVLEVMDLDFVRTARAKGLPAGRIWRRHILKNAMLPIITLASLQAGHLVGGAVLTETVFAWPGIGRLAFDALLQRDYNLLLAIFIIASALVVFFNFIADILYGLADPRIEVTT